MEASSRRDGWRARAGLAGVVAFCVGVAGIAVAGAGSATPGMRFSSPGAWIYNSTVGELLHVNGSAKAVDNRIEFPGAGPGTRVVETDRSGYALADGRIYEFGKSDLKVLDPLPAPAGEQPVGLEAQGSAFAVYRQAGRVVRFGERPTVETPGVPLGEPVVTADGTLWIHRSDNGHLCELPAGADRMTCPARTPSGHRGSLAVVGDDHVVFVDTTARRLLEVGSGGLGRETPLPLATLPDRAVVAGNDLAGRIAIVDPARSVLYLVDSTGGRAPVAKQLRPGRYEQVASSGSSLALIDDTASRLVTLDRDGNELDHRAIPNPSDPAKAAAHTGLFRGGDSRLYVAGRSGEHVLVVDDTGAVTPVGTTGDPETPRPTTRPTQPATQRPKTSPPSQPPTQSTKPTTRKPVIPVSTTTTTTTTRTVEPPRTHQPTTKPPTRRPTQRPTQKPPPVQPSRPGAPRNLTGTAGVESISVRWAAAVANGATITQYQLSWPGGSRTVAGTTRSARITGLTAGTGYVVTVRAVNQAGAGAAATTARLVPAAPAPVTTLTVAKGAKPSDPPSSCDPDGCRYLRIEAKNLRPNTAYHFQPFTTRWQPSNSGATLTTEADGSIVIDDRFATYAPGQQVWVVATAGSHKVTSNRFSWGPS